MSFLKIKTIKSRIEIKEGLIFSLDDSEPITLGKEHKSEKGLFRSTNKMGNWNDWFLLERFKEGRLIVLGYKE